MDKIIDIYNKNIIDSVQRERIIYCPACNSQIKEFYCGAKKPNDEWQICMDCRDPEYKIYS